jgi:type II secretory ATPase GspE/PulE/Tfp pilus assembly ATPase PilB-like protein
MAEEATLRMREPGTHMSEKYEAKERAASIIYKIHSAKSIDDLFFQLKTDLATLFEVEQLTVYAVDREKRELYSKYLLDSLEGVQEIRVPINDASISGYCARYGKILNITDAYDHAELAAINPRLTFDPSWDKRSGFHSSQMLAVPILVERKYLMGVLLLINKRGGGRFTPEEEGFAANIAETLGLALRNQAQFVNRRPTKFDYLFEKKLITQQNIGNALAEARRKGSDVETILIDTYHIAKADVGQALSRFYGCPFLEYDDRTIVDRSLLKDLNIEFLKANTWLPLRRDGDTVEVLIDNPKDLLKTEHIQMLLHGAPLRWLVGMRKDILQYLASATGRQTDLGSIQDILGEMTDDMTSSSGDDDDAIGGIGENDSTIVRLANQIIVDAYKRGASDIHIEPYAARSDTVIRMRIDGSCLEYQRIPPSYRRALVSRLKIMARLDIAERRKPQDGKIKFRLPQGREIELRVATIPTAQGDEDVVMRVLAASEPLPLSALQMTPRNLAELQRLLDLPYGLFLVVGPTGSGKTTTLHAALGSINTPDLKIWTAEDPVEITQYGLRQVQVQPRIGFTFAAAMRAFLRADPDVIMVGEMRDEETAHTGIEASLTGHLVFSTLHTNSAPETITRLLDMGLDPFNFADALLGVLAQRLARTLCKRCKVAYAASAEQFDDLRQAYGAAAFEGLGLTYTPDFPLYRGVGCAECNNTGYRGRVGLHELLVATPEIKRLIQQRARITEVGACAQAEGMTTLLQDGVLKVLNGVTDIAQVKAVASK